jgi:hypothetical protein
MSETKGWLIVCLIELIRLKCVCTVVVLRVLKTKLCLLCWAIRSLFNNIVLELIDLIRSFDLMID